MAGWSCRLADVHRPGWCMVAGGTTRTFVVAVVANLAVVVGRFVGLLLTRAGSMRTVEPEWIAAETDQDPDGVR